MVIGRRERRKGDGNRGCKLRIRRARQEERYGARISLPGERVGSLRCLTEEVETGMNGSSKEELEWSGNEENHTKIKSTEEE